MLITGVHRRRGQLYLLELDGESAMTVDVRTFDESPYREGVHIDDDQLHELLETSRRHRAREKALWLLSGRDYARAELAKKLQSEAGEELAREVAAQMEELGLIREEDYAGRLARDLCQRRHYPRRRALQELCSRGIDRELAASAVESVETDDLQEALALLQKKRYTETDIMKLRQKVTGFLTRQGFDAGTVREAYRLWLAGQETGEDPDPDGGWNNDL